MPTLTKKSWPTLTMMPLHALPARDRWPNTTSRNLLKSLIWRQQDTKPLSDSKSGAFAVKDAGKMAVAETSLVQKNHQIAAAVKQKIAQLLVEKQAMTDIAHRLSISTSTVIRKLKEFKFEMNWQKLPEIMSWDEYSFKKGKMSFTSFCSFTFRKSKLIISLT